MAYNSCIFIVFILFAVVVPDAVVHAVLQSQFTAITDSIVNVNLPRSTSEPKNCTHNCHQSAKE